ncbi:MAG: hypothetical protein GX640_07485 [Fibrobacter sp.]|nr:hypothetical protein [Fibrobacter sp.]
MKHPVLFSILFVIHFSITATTLIVAPSGQMYSSINSAVNAMQPGETVLVKPGKYTGGVYLQKQGLPNAFLTIKNFPGELPELNGWDGDTPNSGAAFTNASNVPASYLRIEGFYATGYKFGLTSLNWTTFPAEEYKTVLIGKKNRDPLQCCRSMWCQWYLGFLHGQTESICLVMAGPLLSVITYRFII